MKKQVDSPFLEEAACLDLDKQEKLLEIHPAKPKHICGTEICSAE